MAASSKAAPKAEVAPATESPKAGSLVAPGSPEAAGVMTPEMRKALLEDLGQAQSFEREELAIPFLRVAQANSPELKAQDAKYIKGLSQGDIFNTVTGKFWPGAEGVTIIPVAHLTSYMEWKPRSSGGGLVHDWGASSERLRDCKKDEKTGKDITPEGNELVKSSLYYVLAVDLVTGEYQQLAFSLFSTQLKKARVWNTKMQEITIPDAAGVLRMAPLHFTTWKVRTVVEKNLKGEWYGVVISHVAPTLQLPTVGEKLYLDARSFKRMVDAGEVKVAVAEEEEAAATGGDGGSDDGAATPF